MTAFVYMALFRKPLCQGQGAWIFDAPPSFSQIPATQDIQGEAANVPSFSESCLD